ncbi:HNH endonuclease [Microbulbifer marinus]|uniref:5-methylcytosine-specific restriction endonuclease McrA n=1 Tax=Microbulbifer marinus TaxID=658218 RepID=A0A1H3ZA07_9GAMM|nr:HNH endonuclease [Microbulbifer marinus]SEA20589.1 5-methylcytosine-specific restriction endonuclease McrA [Microbulbifer marinus]
MSGMRIDFNLSALAAALKPLAYGHSPLDLNSVPLGRLEIDPRLKKGQIEIEAGHIEHDPQGRATFADRPVLLFIKDQGGYLPEVLGGQLEKGKMVHLRRCSTIKSMAEDGRGDRYSVLIRDDGYFPVYAAGYGVTSEEQPARRRVCLICLTELNLIGRWDFNKRKLAASFHFEKYLGGELGRDQLFNAQYGAPDSKRFPLGGSEAPVPEGKLRTVHVPLKKATGTASPLAKEPQPIDTARPTPTPEDKKGEPDSWGEISQQMRQAAGWTCSECKVCLSQHPRLLHVHHRNGQKKDNRAGNLQVLCVECHQKQPMHGHLRVTAGDAALLAELRERQSHHEDSEDILTALEEEFPEAFSGDCAVFNGTGEIVIDALAIFRGAQLAICDSPDHWKSSDSVANKWLVFLLNEFKTGDQAIAAVRKRLNS